MRWSRRVVVTVSVAAALVAAGSTAVAVGRHRPPAPLLPVAQTQFATPAAPVALPYRVESDASCPAYSFGSPVEPPTGHPGAFALSRPPAASASLHLVCLRVAQFPLGGLDGFVDGIRRHPENAGLLTEPVIENGPLGAAVRTEVRVSGDQLTEWRIERDGTVVMVGYLRHLDDHTHDAEVQSMLASWTWG